jgi:hypothetical protein
MATVNRVKLDAYAHLAAINLGLPIDDVWVEKSDSGYAIRQQHGHGAAELAACLTANEAYQFLNALSIGAQVKLKTLRAAEKEAARI